MKTKIHIIVLILLLIPHLVLAGVISLTTTVSTDIMTEDNTEMHVRLLNSGDEPAYDVQTSLITENFESKPLFVGKLNLNEPFEGNINLTLKESIKPGKYPVPVLVDYADANGYPFSSVSPSFIVYKTQTTSRISGNIPELSLTGKEKKELILYIQNLDDVEHDVNVELILPRELKVVDNKRSILIDSKEEKKLSFEVSSLSALPGSSYVVLASLEYEDDLHYSSFVNGAIKITEEKPFNVPIWFLVLSFIVLSLIFIYYKLKQT